VGFHWAIARADRRAFDNRKQIPLHALAGHVWADFVSPTDNLIDLVDEDNSALFHLFDRSVHHLIPIDQFVGFLLDQHAAGLADRQLARSLLLTVHMGNEVLERLAHIVGAHAGTELHGRPARL